MLPIHLITTHQRLMRWPVEEVTHCTIMVRSPGTPIEQEAPTDLGKSPLAAGGSEFRKRGSGSCKDEPVPATGEREATVRIWCPGVRRQEVSAAAGPPAANASPAEHGRRRPHPDRGGPGADGGRGPAGATHFLGRTPTTRGPAQDARTPAPPLRGASLRLVGAPPRFRVAPGRPAPARWPSPPLQPRVLQGQLRIPPSVGTGGLSYALSRER